MLLMYGHIYKKSILSYTISTKFLAITADTNIQQEVFFVISINITQ